MIMGDDPQTRIFNILGGVLVGQKKTLFLNFCHHSLLTTFCFQQKHLDTASHVPEEPLVA